MTEFPKAQEYRGHERSTTITINSSFLVLRKGEYIHIDANGQAVEIKMDDDGNVGVCISKGVDVATFAEIYGE